MSNEQIQLVWVTWARGIDLPPISPKIALRDHPSEFLALFLQMAVVLGAFVKLPDTAIPTPSPSCKIDDPGVPGSDAQQLEQFSFWDIS